MDIKKIVAREGLILLAVSIFSFFWGSHVYNSYWENYKPSEGSTPALYVPVENELMLDAFKGVYIIYLTGWAIYFTIRFIIWAIKTLKDKA